MTSLALLQEKAPIQMQQFVHQVQTYKPWQPETVPWFSCAKAMVFKRM